MKPMEDCPEIMEDEEERLTWQSIREILDDLLPTNFRKEMDKACAKGEYDGQSRDL